jgi:sporulation protein YlmC with PRC-barrel domain
VSEELHLIEQILDREILDSQFLPCGKIDDLELEGEPGKNLRVTAILTGPGAWAPRLPAFARWIAERIAGKNVVRIPWEQVKGIGSHIQLKSGAEELGLIPFDRKTAATFRKIPGGM